MRKHICSIIFLFLVLPWNSYAGFGPTIECTNVGNTIQIDFSEGNVTIVTDKEQTSTFLVSDLKLVNTDRKTIAEESRGQTFTETFSFKIILSRNAGEKMPNAYNLLVNEDGSLSDYFLCKRVLDL